MTGIFPNSTTVGTGTGIFPTDGTPTLLTSPFDGVLKASNAVIGRVVLENPSSTLSIANFPAVQKVEVASFPAVQPVSIVNQPGVQDVRITNPPAQQTVTGTVAISNFPALQEVRLNGESSVTARLTTGAAHIGSVSVAGPISGTVAISNPTTSVGINNFPATQAVTGRVEVSNLPASPTSIRVNNDTTQPIPVAIVSGSAGGGGGGFDGVLKASSATIGTVTLGAPVALASGTSVGISGLVGINNFPTSFNIGNLPRRRPSRER
ncbi:hypothetical protein GCM10025880_56890 [Methylorubrum aminovorans]|uniref:hypothetical protein n=1 Tax=Methylorubrum aminovorans TaxID=269069 RepID=UPI0023E9A246|nr:hypothetical protein [Methylorubrum aminovorans]GMA79272.1 hypothetical protein GCM10025880_56890 [Methylorubrum aminovorans]